jgi:hypothetical protein
MYDKSKSVVKRLAGDQAGMSLMNSAVHSGQPTGA